MCPSGPRRVQLRFGDELTREQYLRNQAWQVAPPERCPLHAAAGCGFARHGTYVRKVPEPVPIARAYCRTGHVTFSFLPDFFASRLPGTLDEVEEAAVAVETAASLAEAAERLRPGDVETAATSTSAERWTSRRVALFRAVLLAVVGLFPDRLTGVTTATQLRVRLATSHALVALRGIAARFLDVLPPPLGFGPRPRKKRRRDRGLQQLHGPDPPRHSE